MGICSMTAVCSKEEPGLEDAPKDMASRVVGAGVSIERRRVCVLQLWPVGQSPH